MSTSLPISQSAPATLQSLAGLKAHLNKPGISAAEQKSVLYLLFTALLGSINVLQSVATTNSKQINTNADLQQQMNLQVKKLQFVILPSNANSNQINQVNEINENVQFGRQDIQSNVITLRQNGQVLMTTAQVNVNYMQQTGSEVTATLKLILSISKLINKISPGAQ